MRDAYFPHYLCRRLLPDVCGYPVSRIASVNVCSEGDVLRLPSLFHHLPSFWGFAILKKLNTEMRICRTKFGMVTLIYWKCQCTAYMFSELSDILLTDKHTVSNILKAHNISLD